MLERAVRVFLGGREVPVTPARVRIEQEKENNRIDALFPRYQKRDTSLTPGQTAKIIHLLSQDERIAIQEQISAAQAEFWQKWTEFRCGLPDEGYPVFDHVVGLLPVYEQFTKFINPQDGDLIVELMGGSTPMAPHLAARANIAGYIAIDSNPQIEKRAQRRLGELNVNQTPVLIHDLSSGLPDQLTRIIEDTKPNRVHYVSNWGITYLPADGQIELMSQCFDPVINGGKQSVLDFNMLTDGQFDPEELERRFKKEVVPQNLIRLKFGDLRLARRAIPPIREFGRTIREVAPIWYPEETTTLLEENGFAIDKVNSSLLWGQSTAIKVTGRN